MKKRIPSPHRLLAATVLLLLLISQGVWIASALQQEKEERKVQFQDSFNQAISFYIYKSESADADPSITEEETIKEIVSQATSIIDLATINSGDDIGKILENAILFTQIELGKIRMNDLDLVIQDCSKKMGNIISARISLYSPCDEMIDNVSHASNLRKGLFSDTYIAERVMADSEKQYTIRAEYQIAPQGYLLRTRNPIIVSVLASMVIGTVLFSRNRTLKRQRDEVQEMQHLFDGAIHDLKSPLKQAGNIVLDLRNQTLICKNEKIKDLRPMEYAVFEKLIDNFGQTVTRKELMVTIWGDQEENYNEHSMNNCIYRVRSLLKNDTNLEIGVNRKLGYKLVVGE